VAGASKGGGQIPEAMSWKVDTAVPLSAVLPASRARNVCCPNRRSLPCRACGLVQGNQTGSVVAARGDGREMFLAMNHKEGRQRREEASRQRHPDASVPLPPRWPCDLRLHSKLDLSAGRAWPPALSTTQVKAGRPSARCTPNGPLQQVAYAEDEGRERSACAAGMHMKWERQPGGFHNQAQQNIYVLPPRALQALQPRPAYQNHCPHSPREPRRQPCPRFQGHRPTKAQRWCSVADRISASHLQLPSCRQQPAQGEWG